MNDIIFINEKTGQIVPSTYPDAVMYQRMDSQNAQNGILLDGVLHELTEDIDKNFECEKCSFFKPCQRDQVSSCLAKVLFDASYSHFEIMKGGNQ